MLLVAKQRKEMLEAAKPLIKWLNDNCHQYCSVVVDTNSVELSEAIARDTTNEFVKD